MLFLVRCVFVCFDVKYAKTLAVRFTLAQQRVSFLVGSVWLRQNTPGDREEWRTNDKKVMLYSLVHLVGSANVDSLMTRGHIDVFEIVCVKRRQNEHTELNRLIPMSLWVVVLLFSIAVSLANRFALPSMDCYFSFCSLYAHSIRDTSR